MELICKKEALDEKCNKIMNFTQGVIYDFEESGDPDGWEVMDDNNEKEVFFNLDLMFEPLLRWENDIYELKATEIYKLLPLRSDVFANDIGVTSRNSIAKMDGNGTAVCFVCSSETTKAIALY